MTIEKSAGSKPWGFTPASRARFIKGSEVGALVCHGFGGTPSNMRCLVEAAADKGCTVSAPLLKGHGSTLGELNASGYEDWRADVENAYRGLLESGCSSIFLCGLSMGALLMADLASRHADDARIAGVSVICPPLKMRGYLNFFSHLEGIAPYVLTSEGFKDDPDMEMYYGMATAKLKDIRILAKDVERYAARIKAPVQLIEAGRDNRVHPVTYKILEGKLGLSGHIVFPEAPHGIPYSDFRGELAELFAGFIAGEPSAFGAQNI